MEFIAPIPFNEAIRKLGDQSVIGSVLSSAEWSDVPVELRDNAFFSSRIESAQFLQRAKDALGDFLAGNQVTAANGEPMLATGSRAAFVSQMQAFLAKEGVIRSGGGLQDITSEKRLGLIFDVKTRQAQDFGYWLQGMDPDVLNEFPAMRFIRVQDVQEPRELHERFQDQVYLKTDPIWWLEINKDFGVPWGPWGWGCGHDVEDVDRDEAEKLGLIKPGQKLTAPKKFLNLNHNLQASTKSLAPELIEKLKQAFGDKIVIDGDFMRWRVASDMPAPVPASVPSLVQPVRTSPVSSAVDVKVHGTLNNNVQLALAAIDKVHDDGDLPEIPLRETRRNCYGYFSPDLTGKGLVAEYMAVRHDGPWPALTTIHEIGHFLDLEAIGAKGNYATDRGSAIIQGVMDAANNTLAIQAFRAHYQLYQNPATLYYLEPVEIWARAYAQFVASRAGLPELTAQLDRAINAKKSAQWRPDDFAPVAAEIEKMFKQLGWL